MVGSLCSVRWVNDMMFSMMSSRFIIMVNIGCWMEMLESFICWCLFVWLVLVLLLGWEWWLVWCCVFVF